jgi:hypothetical protein
MSARCSCNIWRALWITPCLKWSSGRFGKRVALGLTGHKSVNSALTQSFEYFKIREVSEEVAILKVALNYILYLKQFSSISSYFSHAKKPILGIFEKENCCRVGPTGQRSCCQVPRPDWPTWAVPSSCRASGHKIPGQQPMSKASPAIR